MLNLVPGEPLAMVKELTCFNNPIQLDPLLASVLDLCVNDIISCGMFDVAGVEICWCHLLSNVECVEQWEIV